jgi:hypothetical protein
MTNHFPSLSQKKLRFSQNRPKTAPNAKASVSGVTNGSFLTSSNLPSTLRTKKNNRNQVSPLGDNFSLRFNYDVACERHIREGVKAGLINGILTVSEVAGECCVLVYASSFKGILLFYFARKISP